MKRYKLDISTIQPEFKPVPESTQEDDESDHEENKDYSESDQEDDKEGVGTDP